MCHRFLNDAMLFHLLLKIDRDLAKEVKEARCPHCGDRLDVANYRRKPRGIPDSVTLEADFDRRFSFCCDKCRRRATPPSVRFFGRRFYVGFLVVLITALSQGPSPSGKKVLRKIGVDRRTLKRWQQWWREVFPKGMFWKAAKPGLYPRHPADAGLPLTLADVFSFLTTREALIKCLKFLSPITTSLAISKHANLWP